MTGVRLKGIIETRVPLFKWLPLYGINDALGDLVAGLTVGLTLIPQAIAYAALAGLSPQYGLYSAMTGSFVYIFFGTCPEVNIGPTTLISLLTFTYARGIPEYATLLCFLSGCVTIVLGILRLGFLVQFVSVPVVSGFTSAASLIIACSQIKGLLGLKMHAETFVEIWRELYYHIHQTSVPDLILSCCCIFILLLLKTYTRIVQIEQLRLQVSKGIKTENQRIQKFLWFTSIGRNVLVVILSALAAYIFEMHTGAPFLLTGNVNAGLPKVGLPHFSRQIGNHTETFIDVCKNFASGIVVIPLISIIGNVAIAKAFSHRQTLDATQEMLSLGVCNLVGSFFQSMPVTGSFSRSTVSNASGVKTPLGGLYTGILVILSLSLLTPYFYYIPKATLSSVVVTAVIFMIDINIVRSIWRSSKRDIIPTLVTFFACLFAGVELGILIGILVDLTVLIYFNARPTMYIEYRNSPLTNYVLVRPSAGLMFPAVDYLRIHLTEALTDKCINKFKNGKHITPNSIVVLDCSYIDKIDFTAAHGLSTLMRDFKINNRQLILLRPSLNVLQSVQSLTDELIIIARTDVELLSLFKEIGKDSVKQTDVQMNSNTSDSKGKSVVDAKDDVVSTKL